MLVGVGVGRHEACERGQQGSKKLGPGHCLVHRLPVRHLDAGDNVGPEQVHVGGHDAVDELHEGAMEEGAELGEGDVQDGKDVGRYGDDYVGGEGALGDQAHGEAVVSFSHQCCEQMQVT